MTNISGKCELWNFNCYRLVFQIVYSGIVGIITLYTVIRILKVQKQLVFELIPLLFCALSAFVHFFTYIFVENYKVTLINLQLQAIIFSLIAGGMITLKMRLTHPHPKQLQKKLNKIFIWITSVYVVLLILLIVAIVFTNKIQYDIYFKLGLGFILTNIFISTVICSYSSIQLIRAIKIKKESESNNRSQSGVFSFVEEGRVTMFRLTRKSLTENPERKTRQLKTQFNKLAPIDESLLPDELDQNIVVNQDNDTEPMEIVDFRKQVIIVGFSLAFTTLSYFFIIPFVIKNTVKHELRHQIFQLIFAILQITPCILIPYAFYFIPKVEFQKEQPKENIVFESMAEEENQVRYTQSEFLKTMASKNSNKNSQFQRSQTQQKT